MNKSPPSHRLVRANIVAAENIAITSNAGATRGTAWANAATKGK